MWRMALPAVLLAWSAIAGAARTDAEQRIVSVSSRGGDGRQRSFSGVIVAPGLVATAAQAVDDRNFADVTVTPAGASGRRAVTGWKIRSGMALMQVPDVPVAPTFRLASATPPRAVRATAQWAAGNGVAEDSGELQRGEGTTTLAVAVPAVATGGLVVAQNGQALGIIVSADARQATVAGPESVRPLLAASNGVVAAPGATPGNATADAPPPAGAGASDAPQRAANDNKAAPAAQSTTTVTGARQEVDRINARMSRLRDDQRRARDNISRLNKRIGELSTSRGRQGEVVTDLRRQLQDEQRSADALNDQTTRMERTLARAQRSLDAASTERTRMRWIIGGVILLVIVIAGLALFLVLRARSKANRAERARDELLAAEATRSSASDWTLVSSRRRLKLAGARLGDAKRGLVVGRSAEESDVLIESTEISRRHARFHESGSKMFVTDLASLNGVKINGRAIPADVPEEVRSGDQVMIADEEFTLRKL